jgi:hypothetical protein
MFRNLTNEIILDAADVADELLEKMNFDRKYAFVSENSKKPMSFQLQSPLFGSLTHKDLNQPGFYAVYRFGVPLYVGASGRSIANRLSRFGKEVHGKSRSDENHPAAKKYRNHYGRSNFEGLEVVFHLFEPPKNIALRAIETVLISRIKPIYNVDHNTNTTVVDKIVSPCHSKKSKNDADLTTFF